MSWSSLSPLIFSGGCGLASHFVDGFKNTDIDAISAANFFSNRDQNIFELRAQLLNSGIKLRQIWIIKKLKLLIQVWET